MAKLSSLSCLRLSFSFFSILTFSIGCALMALGVYVLLGGLRDVELYSRSSESPSSSQVISSVAACLIGAGCCGSVISFLGCCGSATSSRPLLLAYAALLASIVAAQVTLISLAAIFRGDIDEFLRREIGRDIFVRYRTDERVTRAWDRLQSNLECCGVSNPEDWLSKSSQFSSSIDDTESSTVSWPTFNSRKPILSLPQSCCPSILSFSGDCAIDNAFSVGCYDVLVKLLFEDKYHVVLTVGGVLIGIEALALLIVLILLRMLARSFALRPIRRCSYDDSQTALTTASNRKPAFDKGRENVGLVPTNGQISAISHSKLNY